MREVADGKLHWKQVGAETAAEAAEEAAADTLAADDEPVTAEDLVKDLAEGLELPEDDDPPPAAPTETSARE